MSNNDFDLQQPCVQNSVYVRFDYFLYVRHVMNRVYRFWLLLLISVWGAERGAGLGCLLWVGFTLLEQIGSTGHDKVN